MRKLFTEFASTTSDQWKEQLVKDLKGIDFNQLIWHTDNGFDVKPFYTKEDTLSDKPPLWTTGDWNIGEKIEVTDEKQANQMALSALNGGVSCLCFHLSGSKNLSVLLNAILIEHIAIEFILKDAVADFENQLADLIKQRALENSPLLISVNRDVLAHLAKSGSWYNNQENDLEEWIKLAKFPFNTYKIAVDGSLYHDAGANQVTELALIISHYHEYLNHFLNASSDKNALKTGIQISLAVGSDFFTEIAKFRALRELVTLIHTTYNIEAPLYISATTSHLTLTQQDAYTNLLRSTTQAMSAVIGGCATLYVTPFDELLDSDHKTLSQRMARNQQLILKEECYLNKSADVGAGSYYIESLTEQLGQHAFELFKEWEAKGGFITCLKDGILQAPIKKQAESLKQKAASGKLVIIGVNKFVNTKDSWLPAKSATENPSESLFEPIKAIRLAESFELQHHQNS